MSGALLERHFGYHSMGEPSADEQAINSVPQNTAHLNLVEHSLAQLAQQLAEAKVSLESISQITDRLSRHPALDLGLGGNAFSQGDLAPTDVPMEEFMDDGDFSGEKIGRELDRLRQQLYQQETRLLSFDALAQSRQIDLERVPTGLPVSMLQTRLSSPFGWRIHPITRVRSLHSGLDFAGPKGTPIYASSNGIVTSSGYVRGYGYLVEIAHGAGVSTVYAHNSENLVEAGDIVTRRQLIARMGNTGNSTGSHLHFEVRLDGVPIDPMLVLGKDLTDVQMPPGSSLLETLKLLSQE